MAGGIETPLPQGAGYAVVLGLGFFFSFLMIGITYGLQRYKKEIMTSEEFNTGGRSIGTGLIASAVVSSWTWAATLLTSSTMAYNFGVSGSFFYAAGACVQIVLFSYLAIKAKQRAPECHTYLEIVKARYGTLTHCVFMFFAIATNVLVTAMLLTGTSAVISDLTGMHTVAVCFLMPISVVAYTIVGGLKSTILSDYSHNGALLIIILVFAFTTYAGSDKIGSPTRLWEMVNARSALNPVEGNAGGNYFTMSSRGGGIFFVINIAGNFGTVFLDNGYWNKAIAASPAAAMPGYVLAGFHWFSIPFLCATTMGLACLALEDLNDPLTPQQVSAGLVLPTAATQLLGKGGAVASLLLVFMAATSALSSELISVSSIFTYDIFKGYLRPRASGKTLLVTSHLSVMAFAMIMSAFSTGLWYAEISMGYLYELMGILISAAVVPASCTLLWKDQNKVAATLSPPLGCALAITGWLVYSKVNFGEVTVDTTFEDMSMLTGNCVALLSPLLFVPLFSFIFGFQNFDWRVLKSINRVDEDEEIIEKTEPNVHIDAETGMYPIKSQITNAAEEIALKTGDERLTAEEAQLKRSSRIAGFACLVSASSFLILWPMPMYGSRYIFSSQFFTGWVTVGIIWVFSTIGLVLLLPIWEGRHTLYTTFRGIYWDLSGNSHKLKEWQESHPEELHVVQSQISAQVQRHNRIQVIDDLVETDSDRK
ncbi:Urea and polyamines transporter [Komagataella phaffii CBS 7435]|uniref:Plasma membrane transporter for both urea and polyamines, expression is highly sensitive to nitrogen n=2 Tax=Komagataella phaffii TaxID=460519 RepID=C4QZI2_KOMPG|nr:uncharacterized protein PAS_chr2-1_0055 [Komagataella phaffii GS115]AOA62573.1 GQ67_00079T0 [Komagataella phaffii]KAI0461058.1 hypothetical protein LJB42_001388 [Komagataella kurtzmanii]CAH2448849.1 Urea and polyamines transporter [Komagataella phaffii CBS 7435]AOA66981.1 GQ68_01308T0 [Komagataella phaffii GS115]CAY68656.1 Plasma membrane transporter for both urea and polyamines, expression is highly sensitive to nitrogen [Komagataella phaffii GS115]